MPRVNAMSAHGALGLSGIAVHAAIHAASLFLGVAVTLRESRDYLSRARLPLSRTRCSACQVTARASGQYFTAAP
jgi:hypothetical protein